MKKLNLLKLFIATMLAFAATAFTGCVDDNEDAELPYLEVTPLTLAFDAAGKPVGGGEGKIVVKSNRPWRLVIDEKDSWVNASPTSGNGSKEVSFDIPEEANGRMAKLTVELYNIYGSYGEPQIVTVTQGEGSVSGEVIYASNIGTKAVSSATGWPYADAYDDWQATGTGSEGVTYSSSNVSVRNTGKANIGAYEGASGPNVLFFSTAPAYVSVNKIGLTSTQTKLQLTFGASRSVRNADGSYDNTFDKSKFIVSLSSDGTSWTPVTYDINDGDTKDPFWVLATADFTLSQAVAELYVKFEATEGSVFRMDDIKLTEGMGGQSVDLGAGSGGLVVSPTSVSLGSAQGSTSTVTVTATETWTATTTGSGFTIDKTTDAAGSSTVTVTASNENSDASDNDLGTIVFKSGTDMKTVTVSQKGAGSAGDVIYYTNVGEKTVASPWPYADAYDDWQATGSGSEGVTYSSSNVSVRNTGKSSANAYEGASGPNVLFFSIAPAYVSVNKIGLTSTQTKLQLTFGGSRSIKVGDNFDNTFDASKFNVSLSANGTDWTPITYMKNNGDTKDPYWVFATADFTLSGAVSALYIKFEATESSVFRLDDIKLSTGNGGQSVDLGGGSTTPTLEVAPLDVTLGNTAGATKTFAITTTAAWTAAPSGTGFTVNPASGTGSATVTVTASAANTDSSEKTLGSVLVSATGVAATKTVNVKQAAGGGTLPAGTIIVDFASADIAAPALPQSSSAGSGTNTYTIGGLDYVISSGRYYFKDYSTEDYGIAPYTTLYMQAVGYIQLPAIANKSLTRIVATAAGNIGGSVKISVGGIDGSSVSGGESVTFSKPDVTFNLSGTQENTAYRINVDVKNAQFHKLELTYSDGGVTPPPTDPEITAVNPSSVSFPKEGGNETIAVTLVNQGSSALSVSGLSSPFSASVSGNTVNVSAQANTGAAVNQTLTIAVDGGNSMTVPVSIADGQGGSEPSGDLTLVTTAAGLSNGTYYMAGWADNGAYNVWNGSLMNAQCVTSPYSFADGKLTATTTYDDLTEVTLEAVSGVADAYYIKNIDGKYLTVSKDGKNALALVDEAGNNSWTLSDFDEHGFKGSSNAFAANLFASLTAQSKFIRSYVVTNTVGIGGIAFFKKN